MLSREMHKAVSNKMHRNKSMDEPRRDVKALQHYLNIRVIKAGEKKVISNFSINKAFIKTLRLDEEILPGRKPFVGALNQICV